VSAWPKLKRELPGLRVRATADGTVPRGTVGRVVLSKRARIEVVFEVRVPMRCLAGERPAQIEPVDDDLVGSP
jgi:hypothetical protein